MNLVLLVEGAETEPRVYEASLRHRLPALRRVPNVADLTADGYVLVSGKGYPSCYRRIAGLLQDTLWEGTVVLHFLEGAQTAFQAEVIRQVDAAHAALSDLFPDLVAAAQYLPFFQRQGHSAPNHGLCTSISAWNSAQKTDFLLYYKRLCSHHSLSIDCNRQGE